MTIALWVTFFIMACFTIFVIILTWKRQKRITGMIGMMIAMAVGMVTGLVGGVIIGILFNGDLFLSTIISMGIGMVVGFAAGLPIGILSVLDGMLSGLMGGMMGAMLGEMLTVDRWDTFIKIMFVLFVGLKLTLIYFIYDETTRNGEKDKIAIIGNPFLLATIVFIFFYLYTKLGPSIIPQNDHWHHHSFQFLLTF